ncbi:hypothetical protein C8R43DRAFT_1173464 [Mycena crocata]|nr:hypothetical protein C8R43DRAFT_1173464 [Mycena crocata]
MSRPPTPRSPVPRLGLPLPCPSASPQPPAGIQPPPRPAYTPPSTYAQHLRSNPYSAPPALPRSKQTPTLPSPSQPHSSRTRASHAVCGCLLRRRSESGSAFASAPPSALSSKTRTGNVRQRRPGGHIRHRTRGNLRGTRQLAFSAANSQHAPAMRVRPECANGERSLLALPLLTKPRKEWFDFDLKFSAYVLQRLRPRVVVQTSELGNMAAANERRWHSMTMLRHPDPKLVATLAVTDTSLQVMGSWQKIPVKKGGGMTSRMGFARSDTYLAGGDEWRPLPAYPVPASVTGDLVGFSMVVHEDRMYSFTGHPEVDVFNLRTHTWSALRTFFPEAWPYPKNNVVDYAMHCVRGKIYVFGGSHDASPVGCTLFMELDIAARTWRAARECDNTIFVMYGIADRMAARLAGKLHAAYNSHSHDDIWSWDIAASAWMQRRLSGNSREQSARTCNARPRPDFASTPSNLAEPSCNDTQRGFESIRSLNWARAQKTRT